jgi:hypothetical protein
MPADTCKERLSSHNKQEGRSSCSNQEKQRALAPGEGTFVAMRGRWGESRTGTLLLWQGALFLLHLPFPSPASFTDASQQPSRPTPATTTASSSAPWAATRPITDHQQEKQGPDHPISNSPSPQTELETTPLPQY